MSMICEADKNAYIEPDYISTNNHLCEDTEMITVQMTPEIYKEFVRMRLLENEKRLEREEGKKRVRDFKEEVIKRIESYPNIDKIDMAYGSVRYLAGIRCNIKRGTRYLTHDEYIHMCDLLDDLLPYYQE